MPTRTVLGSSAAATRARSFALLAGAVCSVGLLAAAGVPPTKPSAPPSRGTTSRPLHIPELKRFVTTDLTLPAGLPERFEVTLPIGGQNLTIVALHRSLRSGAFQAFVQDERGLTPVDVPAPRTYRGSVPAVENSGVAVSLNEGKLTGLIDLGDAGMWYVQPASDFDPAQPANRHVVYDARDAIAPNGICGNGLFDLALPDWMNANEMGGGGVAGTQPNIAEIGFDADFEFFQKNGSNVNNTVNDIESVMNGVEFIYDRDVNIGYEFTTIVVRTTTSDPYTTSVMGDLLCEFRTKWNTAPESGIQRDVAQLYTGKSIQGSVIGLAWLGVLCNQAGNDCAGSGNLAYSCVESRYTLVAAFRQSLSAHELGHNWGASHCDGDGDCHIMCSGNGGCDGIAGANLKFGSNEVSQINAFKASVACDQVGPLPLDPPFLDQFPNTSIDATKWTFVNGASTSTAATNEPSATRSLNLDTVGTNEYDDDEIRSNVIKLGGHTNVNVGYFTQHKGVESGETLTVYYWSAVGDWIVLNTITSNGTDETNFTEWNHTLPGNALHDGFRLRFVANGDDTADDWYVDDVSVEDIVVTPPANDECTNATVIGVGSTAFDTTNATNSPNSLPASCNEGAGVTIVKDVWYLLVAPCTGNLTVTTCGTAGFDTKLAAYASACPGAATPVVGCSDNGAGCGSSTSSMTFAATQNSIYYIRLGGAATGGAGTLNVSCTPIILPPANDECTNASLLPVGTTSFDTTAATDSPNSLPAGCNEGSGVTIAKDVWYLFVAPCTGSLTISTCGTAGFDTKLAAYAGNCPTAGSPVVACDDNTAGCTSNTSSMTFATTQNSVYYIRLGGLSAGGAGSITATCTPSAPPCPADFNDDGKVDGADLAVLLGAWGSANADLDGNGTTDGADLAAVLGAWGNCP
jgi:hypothetical protein